MKLFQRNNYSLSSLKSGNYTDKNVDDTFGLIQVQVNNVF